MDYNEGSEDDLIPQIRNNMMEQRNRQYNNQANAEWSAFRDRARQQEERLRQESKPKNVVLGPNALSPARTSLPEEGFEGLDPKTAATLQQKERLANQNLDLKHEQLDTTTNLKQQDIDRKNHLALLHNISDSEKIRLLQEGKVDIQDLKDAAEMARLNQAGVIKERLIAQQGDIKSNQIAQQGDINLNAIAAKGKETRETKTTPSADAGVTAQLPSQQVKAFQLKASQAIQDHPNWKNWITTDPDTGMINITPPGSTFGVATGPTQAEYDEMKGYLRDTPPATTKPAAPAPNTTKPPAKPAAAKPAPKPSTTSNQIIKQYSPSRNQTRISEDGGKTWKVVDGRQ